MIKSKIKNELLKLGYNPLHLGTAYLSDIIYYIYISNQNNLCINLERDIYIIISNHYNKNIQTIKSDIIKATNCTNCNFELLKKNCLLNLNYTKLTPKLVIYLVVNTL